jgi:hypothetical protein
MAWLQCTAAMEQSQKSTLEAIVKSWSVDDPLFENSRALFRKQQQHPIPLTKRWFWFGSLLAISMAFAFGVHVWRTRN